MSRHWCPDDSDPVQLVPAPDDCARALDIAPQRPRRLELPPGAKAGLLLVAAVCGGVVFGLNQTFARADVFAEELVGVSEGAGNPIVTSGR